MYHQKAKSDIQFIGVDWGVNNFRAYAVDAEGNVKQRAKAHQGIHRIKDDNYVNTLKRLLGKWFNKYPDVPVLMCGMIGSSEGWQEVDYIDAPAALEQVAEFAEKIINHRFDREIFIVPGIKLNRGEHVLDVLRGEEVQALGAALLNSSIKKQMICLPGMQTKWIEVTNNHVTNCRTFVTGELFSTLSKYTQLDNLIATNIYDVDAVKIGLDLLAQGHGISNDVITIKMMGVNGQLAPTAIASALCALLIGSEIESAIKQLGTFKEITVIGAAWLFDIYQEIGNRHGIKINPVKVEDATARGLLHIYKNLPHQQTQKISPKITVKNHSTASQFSWG
jgi:2-dehydro-3-deoxygalactonokinase